jgi:hypothetical protein
MENSKKIESGKNLYLLPTDKPSRVYKVNSIGKLDWSEGYLQHVDGATNQNIYITNDEVIEEGDWFLKDGKPIRKSGHIKHYAISEPKIILTTDIDLIKDGVQAISDEFLEWFVKNPKCEEVETERLEDGQYVDRFADGSVVEGIYENYKIIIPQGEPNYNMKQEIANEMERQETLEEVSSTVDKIDGIIFDLSIKDKVKLFDLIETYVKEQQEKMYSEEEALQILHNIFGVYGKHIGFVFNDDLIKDLFEQYRKK